MQEVGAAVQSPLICSMMGIELCYWWKTCLEKMRLESFSAFARPVKPEALLFFAFPDLAILAFFGWVRIGNVISSRC
jgi:hypothetical protein